MASRYSDAAFWFSVSALRRPASCELHSRLSPRTCPSERCDIAQAGFAHGFFCANKCRNNTCRDSRVLLSLELVEPAAVLFPPHRHRPDLHALEAVHRRALERHHVACRPPRPPGGVNMRLFEWREEIPGDSKRFQEIPGDSRRF